MSNQQDLSIFAGETRTLTLYVLVGNPARFCCQIIDWRVGVSLSVAQTQPIIDKTGTIVSAAAGTFTVTVDPWDTMPLGGNYIHQAIGTIDGSLEFVNNSNQEIQFIANDGSVLQFVNDLDGITEVLTEGTLHIQPGVRQ